MTWLALSGYGPCCSLVNSRRPNCPPQHNRNSHLTLFWFIPSLAISTSSSLNIRFVPLTLVFPSTIFPSTPVCHRHFFSCPTPPISSFYKNPSSRPPCLLLYSLSLSLRHRPLPLVSIVLSVTCPSFFPLSTTPFYRLFYIYLHVFSGQFS